MLTDSVEFDIDSDEEDADVCDYRYSRRSLPDPAKYALGPAGRAIAGSKRVATHRNIGGSPDSNTIVMQSITATPALSTTSFEV